MDDVGKSRDCSLAPKVFSLHFIGNVKRWLCTVHSFITRCIGNDFKWGRTWKSCGNRHRKRTAGKALLNAAPPPVWVDTTLLKSSSAPNIFMIKLVQLTDQVSSRAERIEFRRAPISLPRRIMSPFWSVSRSPFGTRKSPGFNPRS